MRIGGSSTGNAGVTNSATIAVAAGATIYLSAQVYRTEAWAGFLRISNTVGNVTLAESTLDTSLGATLYEWEEVLVQWTNTMGATVNVVCRFANNTGVNGRYIWLDSVMIALGAAGAVHPYFDGAYEFGSFAAAAHNSESTMASSYLEFDAGSGIDSISGTVMFWIKPYAGASARWFQIQSTANSDLYMQLGTTSLAEIYARCSSSTVGATAISGPTVVLRQWYHIAMTYAPGQVALYINGVGIGSYAPTVPFLSGASDKIRLLFAGAAIMDDFVTTADVLNPNLIRSIYESDAPVFAESSIKSFRATVDGRIWVDEEGMWGLDTLGNPVIGLYAGAAPTKSWGGQILAVGDFLLGGGNNYLYYQPMAGALSMSAVGGVFRVDDTGVRIAPGAVSLILTRAYRFADANGTVGGLWGWRDGTDNYVGLGAHDYSSGIGALGVQVRVLDSTSAMRVTLSGSEIFLGINTSQDVIAPGPLTVQRRLTASFGLHVGGDNGGVAGTLTLTNSFSGVGAGNGQVKMNGATARNSNGWITMYNGTTPIFLPYWTTITG